MSPPSASLLRFPSPRAAQRPAFVGNPHAGKPHPFEALSSRYGRPLRIALLSDFIRVTYANGAVFQTRHLYQELRRCGHEVTVIGAHDPDAIPEDLAPGTIQLPSMPLRSYPGLHLPMPLERWVFDPDRWNYDLIFASVTSMVHEFGIWLRKMKGIPLLMVNTTHLAAAYDVLLPEKLSRMETFQAGLEIILKRPYERTFVNLYNQGDGLMVLSEGLRTYWRERGVTTPIHVVPRTVQPEIFDRPLGEDPYTFLPRRGPRLLCAGRHTREKSHDRLVSIFAKHVLPAEPEATLTLLGLGPQTDFLRRQAEELGIADRVFFAGEVPFLKMADYYAYADVFVHVSLSETYGNVMGEALWCGSPTVAFADGMGISSQLQDGVNGILLPPGKGRAAEADANADFGRAVVTLIRDPQLRARLGMNASRVARERAHPFVVQQRVAEAFQHSQDHASASGLRPAASGPKVVQWMTTLRHARSWGIMNGGVYLMGHLRPAGRATPQQKHPQFAS